ncbi:MAG: hypothetical protein U0T84_07635 [Chitinophagales bacterium]
MKKLFLIWAPVVAVVLILGSCKKETTEADDPNIVYTNLQKSFDGVSGIPSSDSIDLNQDGLTELLVSLANIGGDTGYIILSSYHQDIQFAISKIIPTPIAAVYAKDATPPLSGSAYYPAAYSPYKAGGYREGLLSGEGYLAFRFTTGTKYQYGWMRVSVNSALTQFKILDYAYSLTPDKAIAVGAK